MAHVCTGNPCTICYPPRQPFLNPLTGHVYKPFPRNRRTKLGMTYKKKDYLDKIKRDPIKELVHIADLLGANPKEEQRKSLEAAMKIWMELLEYKQSKKGRSIKEDKGNPIDSKKAAESAFDLLKELEKDYDVNARTAGNGGTSGVDSGKVDVQAETGTEENLSDDQGQ